MGVPTHEHDYTVGHVFFDVCKDFRYFFYDEMEKLLSWQPKKAVKQRRQQNLNQPKYGLCNPQTCITRTQATHLNNDDWKKRHAWTHVGGGWWLEYHHQSMPPNNTITFTTTTANAMQVIFIFEKKYKKKHTALYEIFTCAWEV